jgi:hypothetical protein
MMMASVAMAGQIHVNGYGAYQTGQGGEFTLYITSASGGLNIANYAPSTANIANGSFQTFCVEVQEHIYTNTDYKAEINHNAIYGGVVPDGDPISVGTGWLYSQFARGTLAGYNYGVGRIGSADLLQKAIWYLENETGNPGNNIFLNAAVSHFGTLAAAQADGGWYFGVYALNLTRVSDNLICQDQLIYVPDGGSTVMLLGLAFAGISLISRRLRG